MFLDDELKEIYEKYDVSTKNGFVECLMQIMQTCWNKAVSEQKQYYLPQNLKRIDASYQLFCDKCKTPFRKEFFRVYAWKAIKDKDFCKRLFKHLNWEIPSE